MEITVIIAEPKDAARIGLRTILETSPDLVIVAETCRASDTISTVSELKPTVLVLEWRMPDAFAPEIPNQIAKASPMTNILLISTWRENEFDVVVNRKPICGCISKNEPECLMEAVKKVARGGIFISPLLAKILKRSRKKELRKSRPDAGPGRLERSSR